MDENLKVDLCLIATVTIGIPLLVYLIACFVTFSIVVHPTFFFILRVITAGIFLASTFQILIDKDYD